MNVFDTHSRIVGDYATYIQSFLNIADPGIRKVVEEELGRGKLWPEPLLQFNPSFEMAGRVADLVAKGDLHPELADIFKGYSLYRHQADAIRLGVRGKDFIVTSGTGSGKSLTYIGSIFHRLLSSPGVPGVTAVIVYPMNALINSQAEEFNRYRENFENAAGRPFPISFGKFTGQENDAERDKIRTGPPKILLTNYMMLELLLTRTRERKIRDAIYANLRFLVFDELHTYRGRQGADIAMLIRRIRAQCSNEFVSIGTSATMVSVGSMSSQRAEVAKVATTLFGRVFAPEQVIAEKLTTSLSSIETPHSRGQLFAAIQIGINPSDSLDKLKTHPVAIWLETCVALEKAGDDLVRRKPQRIGAIVEALAAESGADLDSCRAYLAALLQWISSVNGRLRESGQPYTILPFKLHQFISQTGSVYTTLDRDEKRFITLEPGVFKPDEDGKKPLYPNVFSRATGVAFICVSKVGNRLEPREFRESSEEPDEDTTDGYLIVDGDVWDAMADSDYLPESWFRVTKKGRTPDSKKRPYFPTRLHFDEMGNCSEKEPLKWWGWFMKAPLLFDPTGGVFFDTQTNEGTKLAKLGSEGRSTSTTITAFSILNRLADAGYSLKEQKLLSFTDNRQDAALQSGHFNDFVQVARLRSAIHRALIDANGASLTFAVLGEALFNAIRLPFLEFANRNEEPVLANVRRNYEQCFQAFLFYRAIADLRRSWRIVLPNLEQCALLTVDYLELDDVADVKEFWQDTPLLREMSAPERRDFLATILDFFRLEYALHSQNYLTQSKIKEHEKQFREMLRPPWTLDRREDLREPYFIRFDPLHRSNKLFSKSMGPASTLGKFLKLYVKQTGHSISLRGDDYRTFVLGLMRKLEQADYLMSQTARNAENDEVPIYRLKIEKIVWRTGDGKTVKTDVVKRRSYKDNIQAPNLFFQEIYRRDFTRTKKLIAQDHTGQLDTETRQQREDQFRADWYLDEAKRYPDEERIRRESIGALFCSPTMELGIDIGGLGVVHMRNAPPNPSNYAQRSGRAGRSGQGALIFTYCSSYSPHDRHYFQNQSDLVSGVVQAPRLDLCNRELLETHLNALAISEIGMPAMEDHGGMRPSIVSLVDDDKDRMPLKSEVRSGLDIPSNAFNEIKSAFARVIRDIEPELRVRGVAWYTGDWADQNLSKLAGNLDSALGRWRNLYRSARTTLTRATQKIESGMLGLGSDEYKKQKRNQDQSTRQLDLLRNNLGGRASEHSEFYPYRYLASEGFFPGYNFTRLPLRIFLPTSDSSGEFISRPRSLALREFGPRNIIYYSGRKYQVSQLVVQDAESAMSDARVSKKAGYFLTADQKDREFCPFTGLSLADNANKEYLHHLLEMTESRAEEIDRISCEEEERTSRGYDISTYFSIDGGDMTRVRKAVVRTGANAFLNLRYIPAARLVHVNTKWRAQKSDGFPIGMISGDWRSSMPEPDHNAREEFRLVKLWTSNLADALYIEPTEPLGLTPDGIVTLQYALKRAAESVFQVEPNEIGVVTLGDPELPNILIYEAAEGSLGILSQFADNKDVLHAVVEKAIDLCRYGDEAYKAPASYDDLLSYYNQRQHKIIDRHLIRDALEKLRICDVEIQTNAAYGSYEDHYRNLLSSVDPNSSTERTFLDHLYANGLRLPDAAQKRVDGLFVQPDFYYEPRIWVFCDGTPHDDPVVRADDDIKRQSIIARGDEVWVYRYRDNLTAKVALRPDIFRKVR